MCDMLDSESTDMYFDAVHFELSLDTDSVCSLCPTRLCVFVCVFLFMHGCCLNFQLNNYFQDDEETDEEFQDIAEHKILEVAGQ